MTIFDYERPKKTISEHSIVLDLDETLICSLMDMGIYYNHIIRDPNNVDLRSETYTIDLEDLSRNPGSGTLHQMWGSYRPKLEKFIRWCFDYFKYVCVWTAGDYKYGHAIVNKIFRDGLPRPDVIFTRNDCVLRKDRKYYDPVNDKPLSKMIEAFPELKINHLFIIDDKTYSFEKSNPHNGIKIPPYDIRVPNVEKETINDASYILEEIRRNANDDAFEQLMNWFMRPDVIKSEDVRYLDKSTIFNRNPIPQNIKIMDSSYKITTDHNMFNNNQFKSIFNQNLSRASPMFSITVN